MVGEANIESHGSGWSGGSPSNSELWLDAHMRRTISLVERDKNVPAVLIWSLGNEAGNGVCLRRTYDWIKARDPRRLVQYERALLQAQRRGQGCMAHV